MKMFNDSHLEVKKFFSGTFETHPYEVGWADEAVFFVMVEKITDDPTFTAQVQMSQNGVQWASDGSDPVSFKELGLHIIKVQPNFGNYLRLAVNITGGEMFLNLHIACKG